MFYASRKGHAIGIPCSLVALGRGARAPDPPPDLYRLPLPCYIFYLWNDSISMRLRPFLNHATLVELHGLRAGGGARCTVEGRISPVIYKGILRLRKFCTPCDMRSAAESSNNSILFRTQCVIIEGISTPFKKIRYSSVWTHTPRV